MEIDTKGIAQQLIPMLSEMRPVPSVESVNSFINLAFFASLEQEEGRPVRFALALVDDQMLSEDASPQHWRPVLFRKIQAASLHKLVKLAPAVDYRQTFAAIVERGGELYIAGLIRTNMEYYRISRGDTDAAWGIAYKPLIARSFDTELLRVRSILLDF
jgi:Probable sensor domain DACNV